MFVSCSVCQCLRLSPWPASKHCMNVSNRKLTLALRHTISYGCSELVTSWIKWLKSAGKIQLGGEWEEYSKKMVKGQKKGSKSEVRANGRGGGWDGGRELIGESRQWMRWKRGGGTGVVNILWNSVFVSFKWLDSRTTTREQCWFTLWDDAVWHNDSEKRLQMLG